ncbi:hypothetical protein [uncultured Succinivibrio sp.]|uniref:YkvI family membrane protein n=1 Tax=uncultured Succinivibrio sp. TaxID=540749 RepID=UPI0025F83C13|nr:hypothetical protein [uncultured Succinivibrio sp.]
MTKKYISIAMAYVGVVIGAGLSSGQDILQYFLSYGISGIIGVLGLSLLHIIFGKIIITIGCYFQSSNHQEVLEKITHPVINRLIDISLIISSFIVGFVMFAGAGANLSQQFSLPFWVGTLSCALLTIIVAFMDFKKITKVLGIFTPVIIIMILAICAYTFIGKSYDYVALDRVAQTIKSPLPNITLAVINYYSLCAISAVSMAFVLGGSVVRIGVAEKGGLLGGTIISFIITCATVTLYANIDSVKDADIPMLQIVKNISPIFAFIYSLTIFALIFNTAFSLFYAFAKRFAGRDKKKLRKILCISVSIGFVLSFCGFKNLVTFMYPILGYIGMLLLAVLLLTWIKEKKNILTEKRIRKKMINLAVKKYDEDLDYTKKDRELFHSLGEKSVVDTEEIKSEIKSFVKETGTENLKPAEPESLNQIKDKNEY